MKDVFSEIYRSNYWSNPDSVSGHGSDMEATKIVRREIPSIIEKYEIRTILDIPCGDFYWMNQTNLDGVHYIGADIVPELIEANRRQYPDYDFRVLDIVNDDLPPVDLIFVRDCLGHLSNSNIRKAIKNLRKSGAKYLLATTFPEHENNGDIKDGEWRPINLAMLFGLPNALEYINEGCTAGNGKFADKSLGLWRLR